MQELRQIVKLWREGGAEVLATLVHVEGSSYRRAGARLLIAADGRYAGAISGGCLEADLMRRARWAVREGAAVQRYSTLFDDTAEIPFGLGCGGTVDVLLEPAGTPEFHALLGAIERSVAGDSFQVSTWLPRAGRPLRRVVTPYAAMGVPERSDADFTEVVRAPRRVVVIGAGDDALPLVRLCALMGWDVRVVDGRRQWATVARFPEATSVSVSEPLRDVVAAADAVVLMTHSYEQDRAWLVCALQAGAGYLGLLGSRHRSALLISEAAAELHWPVDQVCARVYAPVGLHLGGDGAEPIALAIAAELQAVFAGMLGESQRMTAAAVAEQVARGGASLYLQTQCAL